MTENLTFSDKIHEFYCSCSSGISATGDFSLVDPRPGSFDGCIRNVSANWIQEAGAFVLSFRIPLENYYDRCKSFFCGIAVCENMQTRNPESPDFRKKQIPPFRGKRIPPRECRVCKSLPFQFVISRSHFESVFAQAEHTDFAGFMEPE